MPSTAPSAQSSEPSGKATRATVRKRARRSPPASVHRGQLAEQLGYVVGVGHVLAGVASRVHTGRATECVDLETGIVGYRRLARRRDQCARLEAGVVEQGLAVLDHVGHVGRPGQQRHLERVRENRLDFGDLVGIGRRQHEPQRGGRRRRARRSPRGRRLGEDRGLHAGQLLDARLGQAEQAVELAPGEGHAFGGALHFDEATGPGHDDVHVDFGP